VVDRVSEKHDAVLQETGVDVVGALAPAGLLHHHRDEAGSRHVTSELNFFSASRQSSLMRRRSDRRMFDQPGERLLLRETLGDLATRLGMAIEVGKALAFARRGAQDLCDPLVDLRVAGGYALL